MKNPRSYISIFFLLFYLFGIDLNAQSYNPAGENTTEYTQDLTTNHFFYKSPDPNGSVDNIAGITNKQIN